MDVDLFLNSNESRGMLKIGSNFRLMASALKIYCSTQQTFREELDVRYAKYCTSQLRTILT